MKCVIKERMIEHIPVLEVVPEETEFEALPCVIFYHGWETSKELALTPARKIAQKNNRVILPDAMFHGKRCVENKSTIPSFTFWSSIQHNLIEFSLIKDFLENRQLILDNQLSVGGYSMGGMTSAGLLTKHAEITSAAILMGTPNYQEFIDRLIDYCDDHNVVLPIDFEESLSWTDFYDLSKQPEKVNGRPVYFWHGTRDEKIPYYSSRDFFDSYIETDFGQRMVFETGINEPHLLRPEVMESMAQFLDNHFIH